MRDSVHFIVLQTHSDYSVIRNETETVIKEFV